MPAARPEGTRPFTSARGGPGPSCSLGPFSAPRSPPVRSGTQAHPSRPRAAVLAWVGASSELPARWGRLSPVSSDGTAANRWSVRTRGAGQLPAPEKVLRSELGGGARLPPRAVRTLRRGSAKAARAGGGRGRGPGVVKGSRADLAGTWGLEPWGQLLQTHSFLLSRDPLLSPPPPSGTMVPLAPRDE